MVKQDLGRLKKVIVVRHGEFDKNWQSAPGHLNEKGKEQIEILAAKIKAIVSADWHVAIIASPVDRTKESAQIIARHIKVPVQVNDNLFCQSMFEVDYLLEQVLRVVLSLKDDCDVVILVTHMHLCEDFPAYFAHEAIGLEYLNSNTWGTDTGEGWIVDTDYNAQKTIQEL